MRNGDFRRWLTTAGQADAGNTTPSAQRATLPLILLAAVAQGWALYGLHHAIKYQHWPATRSGWLISLYALALFVPVSVQLLAAHARRAAFTPTMALLGIAFGYFGWHFGSAVAGAPVAHFQRVGECFPLAAELVLLWLLVLPFIQCRLASGGWALRYPALFANAWRNKISLAEAVLFTGLFWVLLTLWQSLFHMLQIDFFRDLFEEPIFVYPVTALAFGVALYLVGSIDALVSAVLEQVLNVLKWLATVAALILALFTVALAMQLPGLMFTGQRAIGAAWLLWLVAVMVLLLNAAYRDGTSERPYPAWLAMALRVVVPLMVVIAATALYALCVRTQHYGLTVLRVWAFITAGAALAYALGYALSAFGRGPWLAGIARVNVVVALALITTIAATLTPLLSPYRLAANSQYHRILAGNLADAGERDLEPTPYRYLRFDSGSYGRDRLAELSTLQQHANAGLIRQRASAALNMAAPGEPAVQADAAARVATLPVYPLGRTLDAGLSSALLNDWHGRNSDSPAVRISGEPAAGLFVDLDGDGTDEFVLLQGMGGVVYQAQAGHWQRIGNVFSIGPAAPWPKLSADLQKGTVTATAPKWRELTVGDQRFRVQAPK